MIHELDESLRNLVRTEVLNGSDVDVSFEPPTKDWASRRSVPTINVFLFDLREDTSRRHAGVHRVRDEEDGTTAGRRRLPRWFQASYLLSAISQRPADEHRLLGTLLSVLNRYDALPPSVLAGSLTELEVPLRFTVALPTSEPNLSASDVWGRVGGSYRPALRLTVTVPFLPGTVVEAGPPVREGLRIEAAPREEQAAPEPESTEAVHGGTPDTGRNFGFAQRPRGT